MGMPVAERVTTGIQVAEQSGSLQAIERAPTAVTAFVGRTLRGPVNRPVTITSFSDFQSVFGGLWQPSTLSYAVEQFFENGGRTAIVVRVVNGARAPTLTLPAPDGQLKLQAVGCGTREYLRASVDYDGIGAHEEDRFNLVLQRVRAPGSEHIEDQEIFRRVSVLPGTGRFVATALVESTLARVVGPVPSTRPDRTLRRDGRGTIGYVHSNPDGDDGAPLTDYDIIGSATDASGLFALEAVDGFNLLCIPPLARETDIGPSALLVAARYCRSRNAMLVVDPPSSWTTAAAAIAGMRDWQLMNENALMYFPRVLGYDRLRGRFEPFAPCGAVAGMLARTDEIYPVWAAVDGEEAILRPGYRPLCPVEEGERERLAQFGVNVISFVRSSARHASSIRTLAGASSGSADWKYLSARRLTLFILNSIERGTRWVVFENNGPATWQRVREQVEAFLEALDHEGAFIGRSPEEAYRVVCDERVNDERDAHLGTVRILVAIAAVRAGEFHSYLISHNAAVSRVRPASLNRFFFPKRTS
jgi:phage tail sheath protein FI